MLCKMKCMKRCHAINASGGHLFFRRCVTLCVLCAEETALLDDLSYFLCKSTKGFSTPTPADISSNIDAVSRALYNN